MNQHRLLFELDRVASRFRLLRFWQGLAAAWLIATIAGLAVWGLKAASSNPLTFSIPLLCLAAFVLAATGAWMATLSVSDYAWVARRIEAAFPELRTCLLAAVEQRPSLPDGRFGYLQSNVIHQALLHAQRHEWRRVVPVGRIAGAAAVNVAAFVLFVLVLVAVAFTVAPSSTAASINNLRPLPLGTNFAV